MPMCQVCQHDNPTGAEFCEECGASLTSPVGSPPGASPGPSPAGSGATGGAPSGGAPAAGGASGGSSAGGGPSVPSTGGTSGTGPSSVSSTSPEALGEAGASVGTTLSGAGDVGVAADKVEAASPNANAAPAGTSQAGAGASTSPGAAATGAAASAATSQADAAAPPQAGSDASAAVGADAQAASGAQQARLVAVRYGAPTGQEIPLLGQRLVVGRFDPETGPVDIDLSELGEAVHVSRQHGELFREADGRWMVRDLGSTNGVFVKGSADGSFGPRITAPRALANGDEVTFGNARFVFRTE